MVWNILSESSGFSLLRKEGWHLLDPVKQDYIREKRSRKFAKSTTQPIYRRLQNWTMKCFAGHGILISKLS